MMTAYARTVSPTSTTHYMPLEPDGNLLRLDAKFENSGSQLIDHAFMGNVIELGYDTVQPTLLKNTEDDGITAGEIVSILDGEQHYCRIPINDNTSIKKMFQAGKTGVTYVYRLYIMKLKNQFESGDNNKKATLFYLIENDQLEYAVKAEIDDSGLIYFYFRYQNNTYWATTQTSQVDPRLIPDYRTPDYDETDYDAVSEFKITLPVNYYDYAFKFNFSTHAIEIITNGVTQAINVGSVNPTSPVIPFPPSYADPPIVPDVPEPYLQPFTSVYSQPVATGSVKINAVTVSDQTAIYNVAGSAPITEQQVLRYNVQPGTQSAPDTIVDLGGIDTTDDSWVPLVNSTSNVNNCKIAAIQILNVTSGLGKALDGKVINTATFYMQQLNAAVGKAYVKIWDSSGVEKHNFGGFDVSKLATTGFITPVDYFDNTNTYRMGLGDRIGVEYTEGVGTDTVRVQRNNTDKDPSICQSVVHPGQTTFVQNTTYDLRCFFKTGTGAPGILPYLQVYDRLPNGITSIGEHFGPNAPMVGIKPTLIEFKVYRDSTSTTAGTVFLRHLDNQFNVKATLTSIAVSALPISDPGAFNLTWQDLNYQNPILANETIAIQVSGVTSGFVYVLTNWNNATNNNYDGNNSIWTYKTMSDGVWKTDTGLDMSGRISSGGASYSGYINLDDKRKRTGIKADLANSTFINQKLSRVTVPLKIFGVPVEAPITCRIRDKTGVLKVTMGQSILPSILDQTDDTSIDFINTDNTYQMVLDDTISIEYDSGTATDFVMVRTAQEATADTVATTLFESVLPNLAITTPVTNLDLAAIVFTGGIVDTAARSIRGIHVNTGSILINQPITEIRIKLKATGTLPLLTNLSVMILSGASGGTSKTVVATFPDLDFNAIPQTQFTEFAFQNTNNTHVIAVGDYIAVKFDHGNSTTAFIEMNVSVANTIDGNNTVMFDFNGVTYTDIPNQDMTGTMYIGGYLVTPDPSSIPVQIPFHYDHALYLSASTPPDSNAVVVPSTLKPPAFTYLNNISKQFRIYSTLLTADQLSHYYNNRWTISALPYGKLEVVGNSVVPWNTAL